MTPVYRLMTKVIGISFSPDDFCRYCTPGRRMKQGAASQPQLNSVAISAGCDGIPDCPGFGSASLQPISLSGPDQMRAAATAA